jgi:3-deoxy-D-manno-octulosonic-acid transferase
MMDTGSQPAEYKAYKTWLYNLALVVLLPLLGVWLVWRMLFSKKSREGLGERLGNLPDEVVGLCKGEDPVFWFHAASVGEVAAAEPIIAAFRMREPLARVIVSTITSTGRERASKLEGHVDGIIYFPFDLPHVVQRVFSKLNPSLFVMVETELWPNALAEARRRGVKTAMVNARLSGKSWNVGRFLKPVYRWMLEGIEVICAQSELDAERFVELGAARERVLVAGNSKFDQNFPPAMAAEADKWRHDFGFELGDGVLLAGSTHPGEEEQILHIFQQLRGEHGDLQLIIAPRHPERGDAVEELIRESGYEVVRRTRVLAAEGPERAVGERSAVAGVGLLDTIGELASVFSAADVVFMGGSLAKIGGHDILQPLAQGKPVVFGPYMHKSRDITELALREGVAFQVDDSDGALRKIDELLKDDSERARLAVAGPVAVEKYRGASERCAAELAELVQNSSFEGEQ